MDVWLTAAVARSAPKSSLFQPAARPASSSGFSAFGLPQAARAGKAKAALKGTPAGAVPSASTAFPSWGLPQPALASAAPSQGQAKDPHAGAASSSLAAAATSPRTVANKAKISPTPTMSQQKVCIAGLEWHSAYCTTEGIGCCEALKWRCACCTRWCQTQVRAGSGVWHVASPAV